MKSNNDTRHLFGLSKQLFIETDADSAQENVVNGTIVFGADGLVGQNRFNLSSNAHNLRKCRSPY